ncbi:hypothetical protein [Magnetospirillum fulvum]|uniref:Uncharacterized protein n=1 Tax=Magnetospirillum fulvum MGU-K5 TaxID=1316936 RepID=S9SCC8_MAGFU|nr:hypothetical protein [Magnetospirillum fulvum]EPY03537.1 hypothetical protein K678_00460 [Magnetospirillum fulvum MGU-K5]
MTSPVQSGIPVSTLRPIDMSTVKAVKLEGQDLIDFYRQTKEIIEQQYTVPTQTGGYGEYAQVEVNGKKVATLTNEGYAETSENLAGLNLETDAIGGPQLAQRRADQIAKALGGTVVLSPSAMTQTQWQNRPAQTVSIDFNAMKRDGQMGNWANAASFLTAQLMGQYGKD